MKYTVVWRPSAEARLAEMWLSASNRQAITRAADSIDAQLRANPLQVGESRFGNARILIEEPLSIYYDVFEDDRLVAVWAVWQHG